MLRSYLRCILVLATSFGLAGCADERLGQLRQAGFSVKTLLENPCSNHKSEPNHVCPRTMAEIAEKLEPKPGNPFDAVCLGVVSDDGRKLFPLRSKEEYRFGAQGPASWPSRISITYRTPLPWSVALCPLPEGIDLKLYGTDTSQPVEVFMIRKGNAY